MTGDADLKALLEFLGAPESHRGCVEWLRTAIDIYRENAAEHGPRMGDLLNDMTEIESLSRQLEEKLGRFVKATKNYPLIVSRNGSAGLITPATYAPQIQGLHMLFRSERERFLRDYGEDVGGQTSAKRKFRGGGARLQLAWDMAHMWLLYRELPSGTADGPFHQFVLAAHECATGEEGRGFDREIKDAAKRFKECFGTPERAEISIKNSKERAKALRSRGLMQVAQRLEKFATMYEARRGSSPMQEQNSPQNRRGSVPDLLTFYD